MKKTILLLLIFSMLSIGIGLNSDGKVELGEGSFVSAGSFCFPPFPVWGKYDYFGEKLKNQEVIIATYDNWDRKLGEFTAVSNKQGEYQFDLGNIEGCYYNVAKIKIKGCDVDPLCTQTIETEGKDSIRLDFIFTESGPTFIEGDKVTISTEKKIYVCWDGSGASSESACPPYPEPEPETIIVCEDGSEVDDASKCPIVEEGYSLQQLIIGMIATIIGIFAWGKGFAGLIKYYLRLAKEAKSAGNKELALKYQQRAEKMAKTVLTNFLAGKYKK